MNVFWDTVAIMAGTSLTMALILGLYLWGFTDKVINKILDRYEDRVNRQSLAEARRLVDANRRYPARPDAGAPAVIHRGLKNK
jgi:hypothetical protein